MSDKDLTQTNRLIFPARINPEEPERLLTVLRALTAEIESAVPQADRRPKRFLRSYLESLSTIREVAQAAEDRCIQDWSAIGGNKSDIARITGHSRSSVGRKASSNTALGEHLDKAEAKVSALRQAPAREPGDEPVDVSPAAQKKAAPKSPGPEENPYTSDEYAEIG